MNKIRTPSLAELKSAGYHVNIRHGRSHRLAFIDPNTSKLVVKTMIPPEHPRGIKPEDVMIELLPKGGLTEVWVTDPETSAEFYGYARCHKSDNYNKKDGINKALERVMELMLVMDGKDGFKMKLTV